MTALLKKLVLFLIILFTVLSIQSIILPFSNNAEAVTISDSFRPRNEPFNINDTLNAQDGGAKTGTIVFLQIISGALLYFAAPIGVIMIVLAGFKMVVGGDDSEQVTQAKTNLMWAIVGVLVVIFSYSMVRWILDAILTAGNVATS